MQAELTPVLCCCEALEVHTLTVKSLAAAATAAAMCSFWIQRCSSSIGSRRGSYLDEEPPDHLLSHLANLALDELMQ